jgi:hypothetical protein
MLRRAWRSARCGGALTVLAAPAVVCLIVSIADGDTCIRDRRGGRGPLDASGKKHHGC